MRLLARAVRPGARAARLPLGLQEVAFSRAFAHARPAEKDAFEGVWVERAAEAPEASEAKPAPEDKPEAEATPEAAHEEPTADATADASADATADATAEKAEAEAEVTDAKADAEAPEETEAEEVDPLEKALAKSAAAKNDLLRQLAANENERRQRQKELTMARKNSARRVAGEIARVAGHVTEACGGLDKEDPVSEGLLLTRDSFVSVLDKHGLQAFAPGPDEPFSGVRHEKVGETAAAEGKVSVEAPGWLFRYDTSEEVLVKARVKVGSPGPATPPAPE